VHSSRARRATCNAVELDQVRLEAIAGRKVLWSWPSQGWRGVFDGDGMSQSRRGPQPQTTHLERGAAPPGSTLVARSHNITLDVEAHEIRPSSLDIGQVTAAVSVTARYASDESSSTPAT
jgi:hypothetical protein